MNFSETANNKAKSSMVKEPLDQVQPELDTFEQQLFAGLDPLLEEIPFGEYLEKLVELAPGIMLLGMSLSERGAEQLATKRPKIDKWPTAKAGFFFSYYWPESLKSLMILWRGILIEGNKAISLSGEEKVDLTTLKALRLRSVESLKSYWGQIKVELLEKEKELSTDPAIYIDQWNHQHNPWPVYEMQLQTLGDQIVELRVQQGVLAQASMAYQNIHQLIKDTVLLCEEQLEKINAQGTQAVEYIQKNETEKPALLIAKVNEVQLAVNFPHRLDNFLSQLETHIDGLPEKVNVVARNEAGRLSRREILFRKISRQWLESEIVPQLYEFWEIIDQANNGMQVSLLNINNRISLLEKDSTEDTYSGINRQSLCQPLQIFLESSDKRMAKLSSMQSYIEDRLNNEFQVSSVYNSKQHFLPSASGINQLRLNQNEIWQGVAEWWNKGLDAIKRLRSTVEQEEALSISEKIARTIEQRTGNPKNVQYNNIFLTKGYLGESFVVGRQQEFRHVERLIGQWNAGFRGAVLLSGSRFCGKTLFGDMVANKFFHRKTIRLQPNAFLQVDGRRFTTKSDLQEALEFIKKHTINQRPLIWLDDLELWNDPAYPLGRNIRVLEKFISNHSGRMFFLVSTSNELNVHMRKAYQLENSFQATLSLDKMAEHEIKEAILIRHGATHKKLVTPEWNVVNPGQFRKMTERVIKQTKGNIGETFFKWSMHVDLVDAERVCFVEQRIFYLPSFLNADSGILLAAIHLEKSTNEYRLRKIFGPAFKEKYSAILQRLLRTKVLIRRSDGWLSINDLLVNELVDMLVEEKYLLN